MPTALFKKLNYKNETKINIINAPESFNDEINEVKKNCETSTKLSKTNFVLFFVTKQHEIENFSNQLKNIIEGDATIWFCYPKQSSKKYTCDFNRDNGWQSLGKLGYEPVRMVAIDEDWSALRFRLAIYIKKITRRESFALTKEAKQRTTQKGK